MLSIALTELINNPVFKVKSCIWFAFAFAKEEGCVYNVNFKSIYKFQEIKKISKHASLLPFHYSSPNKALSALREQNTLSNI